MLASRRRPVEILVMTKSPEASMSRSSKSSVIFPMQSFEEAAKNANNSRTLVDKVERNADVPTEKTTKVEVGVSIYKFLSYAQHAKNLRLFF